MKHICQCSRPTHEYLVIEIFDHNISTDVRTKILWTLSAMSTCISVSNHHKLYYGDRCAHEMLCFSTSYLMVTQKQIIVRSWRQQSFQWVYENTSNKLFLCVFQFGANNNWREISYFGLNWCLIWSDSILPRTWLLSIATLKMMGCLSSRSMAVKRHILRPRPSDMYHVKKNVIEGHPGHRCPTREPLFLCSSTMFQADFSLDVSSQTISIQ